MADPMITVAPPRRDPRLGGLLNVVEVREGQRLAAALGIQYVAEPCNFGFGEAGFCYGDITPAEAPAKTYEGIENATGVIPNFAAFYGVECYINDDSDVRRRAEEAFALAEGRHVESKLATWLNALGSSVATNLTDAVAAADQHADLNYIARPVIHMSRGNAVQAAAAQAIWGDGSGRLWTVNGTPVVASAEYGPDLYVTGAITVYRSATVVNEATAQNTNREQAIAERAYGIAVDCDYGTRFDFTA